MTTFPEPAAGVFDGPVHRYAVRVFYDDTDAGGVVYHANYLRWFERARSDMVQRLGIDQRAAMESGEGVYAVAEAQIRYLSPARLGDTVLVVTRAVDVGAASCTVRQVAWRNDTRLSEARIRLGFVGPDGRPRRQPQAWRTRFAAIVSVPEGKECR